jgi:hypothetical protein
MSIISLQYRRGKLNLCALLTDSKVEDFLAFALHYTVICSKMGCVRNRCYIKLLLHVYYRCVLITGRSS